MKYQSGMLWVHYEHTESTQDVLYKDGNIEVVKKNISNVKLKVTEIF